MADKFRQLLAARRRFDAIPWDSQAVADERLPMEVLAERSRFPDVDGVYVRHPDGPDAAMPDAGLRRATALYKDRGDRATRRHEVMHGIRDAATHYPELSGAIPWWARRSKAGSFEDELLARLAGGDVWDWPMSQYFMDDPLKYGVAMPFYAAARNPEGLLAGAVGTGATLAYALSGEEEKPPQEEIARKFDSIIGRLALPPRNKTGEAGQ